MPRYADIDAILSALPDDLPYKASVKRVLMQAPEADVVPRSEYDAVVSAVDNSTKEFLKLHDEYQGANAEIERLKHILNCYALQYGTVTEQQRVIDKAKSEVAREIFEEIEKISKAPYGYICLSNDELAELKKKYVKDCRTCKHLVSCEPNPFGYCDEYTEGEK